MNEISAWLIMEYLQTRPALESWGLERCILGTQNLTGEQGGAQLAKRDGDQGRAWGRTWVSTNPALER